VTFKRWSRANRPTGEKLERRGIELVRPIVLGHVACTGQHEQASILKLVEHEWTQRRRHERISFAPDQEGWGGDCPELGLNVLDEEATSGAQDGDRTGAERIDHQQRQEVRTHRTECHNERERVRPQRTAASNERRSHEDQATHRSWSAGGEADGDVAAHRMGDDMARCDADGLDPFAEPVGGLLEREAEAASTKGAEPRKIQQIDRVRFGNRRNVPPPPPHRSCKTVDENQRLSGSPHLV
jgi:hypothetical protein